MKINYNFDGYRLETIDENVLERDFDLDYDNGYEAYYISKKTYSYDSDTLKFNYKYIVGVVDLRELLGDDEIEFKVNVYLVPTFDCWKTKYIKEIIEAVGVNDIEDVSIVDTVNGCYGNNIVMATETILTNVKDINIDSDSIMEMVKTAAFLVEDIDLCKAYYLTRFPQDMFNNGWDKIKQIVKES